MSHYLPLYTGDYLRDTLALNTTEHGAYLTLIMAAWSSGGALSADRDELYRLAFASTALERKAVEKVVARYWIANAAGLLVNPRLLRELAREQELFGKRSQGGKTTAAKRNEGRTAARTAYSTPGSSPPSTAASTPRHIPPATRPDQNQAIPATPSPLTSDAMHPSSLASSSVRVRAREGHNDGGEQEEPQVKTDCNGTDVDDPNAEIGWDGNDFPGITAAHLDKWSGSYNLDEVTIRAKVIEARRWLRAQDERQRQASLKDGANMFMSRWLWREYKATRAQA